VPWWSAWVRRAVGIDDHTRTIPRVAAGVGVLRGGGGGRSRAKQVKAWQKSRAVALRRGEGDEGRGQLSGGEGPGEGNVGRGAAERRLLTGVGGVVGPAHVVDLGEGAVEESTAQHVKVSLIRYVGGVLKGCDEVVGWRRVGVRVRKDALGE